MGSGRSKGSELHRHRAVWSIDRPGLRETDIWQPGWQTGLGKEMKSRGSTNVVTRASPPFNQRHGGSPICPNPLFVSFAILHTSSRGYGSIKLERMVPLRTERSNVGGVLFFFFFLRKQLEAGFAQKKIRG